MLTQQRWRSSLFSAKTYPCADCGSDHELLVATTEMKMRKTKKSAAPIRFDLSKIPTEYGIEITNKFDALLGLAEEMTPDELASEAETIILETAKNHIPKRTKKKQVYISEASLKLIEERRDMKVKGFSQNTAQSQIQRDQTKCQKKPKEVH